MSYLSKRNRFWLTISLVALLAIAGIGLISNVYATEYSLDVIPTMTSNTAPSGTVTASNNYGLLYPWKAFNDDPRYSIIINSNTDWKGWGTHNTTGWLAYEFPVPKAICKYTMQTTGTIPRTIYPKAWTFEAWDTSLNNWVVLDTRTNITGWTDEKREFTFNNNKAYLKYRFNITENNGSTTNQVNLCISQIEMMEAKDSLPQPPTDLTATPGKEKVTLSWLPVDNATRYNVKRSLTPGGPYNTINSNVYATSIDDLDVISNQKYYYVVTVIVNGNESPNSNEVSATPLLNTTNLTAAPGNAKVTLSWSPVNNATGYNVKRSEVTGGPYTTISSNVYDTAFEDLDVINNTTYYYVVTALDSTSESDISNEASATPMPTGNNALLTITMANGTEKEYDLTAAEVEAFVMWYNTRENGDGAPYYVINKNYNQGPFIARKDHLVFDKIVSFEVKEY